MRKHLARTGLALLFVIVLSSTAVAQLKISPQLGLGVTSHREENYSAKEWLTRITFNYTHKELLFTGEYHSANGLDERKLSRDSALFSANYLIFREDILRIYGGLGYQFLKATPLHSGGLSSIFTGNDFVGQAVVAIDILEDVKTTLTVNGTPWLKWSSDTGDDGSGSSFTYHLHVAYDFKDDYGLHLGLLGGNYKIPVSGKSISSSFTGVNLGLIWRF